MYLLAPTFKQHVVRRFLNQGVFKDVLGIWWRAAPKEQFSSDELIQGIIEFLLINQGNSAD